jgi:hypothetical protein
VARPQDFGWHVHRRVGEHLLAVMAEAKCRASWKKNSLRPEFADDPASPLK